MATILTQNEEEKEQNQPNTQVVNTPILGSSTAQPQRQGSGRFTNIQKYINANKTAGQNLVGSISGNIQKEINRNQEKTDEAAVAIRQGVQQGQQGLNQGSQFGQQLNTIGQNIAAQTSNDQNKNFANRNVNNLGIDQFDNNNYQKFQQGQGLDEIRLGLQNKNFINQGQNLQNIAQQNLENISTDSGRFNMIRNMFGKNTNPGYSAGQQRLDTMFLSQDPLTNLRKSLTGTQKTAQQTLAESQRLGQDVSRLTQAEKDLIAQNKSLASTNTDAYLKMLDSYTGELNQQRSKEFQTLQDQINSLRKKDIQSGGLLNYSKVNPELSTTKMDSATLQKLGLTGGPKQVYNTFEKLKNVDIANRGRDAAGYQDIANQLDVDKFALLSKIAQQDPTRLNQVSQLGDAWTAKTGSDSLASRINQAAENFNKFAQNQNYQEHYKSGRKNWAQSDANLLDLMQGGNINQIDRKEAGKLQAQAQAIYQRALNDMSNQGYGNVLNIEDANIQNVLPLKYNVNYGGSSQGQTGRNAFGATTEALGKYLPLAAIDNALGVGKIFGSKRKDNLNQYSSNLDEIVQQRLKRAGIK